MKSSKKEKIETIIVGTIAVPFMLFIFFVMGRMMGNGIW